MSVILNIETSTEICSVCLSSDNDIIFNRIEMNGPSHAVLLGVFVADAIKFLRQNSINLDAVAVSCGPGSYTGLRIGVSEAKGVCYGLSTPLIAINTLSIVAHGIIEKANTDNNTLLCPMIDARRMEVYSAIFDTKLNFVRETQADIIDENSYSEFLDKQKVVFFGNGANKCKDTIKHSNAIFIDHVHPLATDMVHLANKAFNESDFVDIAYFEPFYLKEFVATTPKNKVL